MILFKPLEQIGLPLAVQLGHEMHARLPRVDALENLESLLDATFISQRLCTPTSMAFETDDCPNKAAIGFILKDKFELFSFPKMQLGHEFRLIADRV